MKNKKGFSLLELLFVMVILAIIVIAIYPKILNYYNDAKKSTFLTSTKSAIKTAGEKYQTESMNGNKVSIFAYNGEDSLELTNDLKYCINMDEKGNVLYAKVTNGSYYFEGSEETISKSSSDMVNYGDFSKFDCNYTLDKKDIYDQKEITGMSSETRSKVLKYLGIAFGVTLVLSLITKKTIER